MDVVQLVKEDKCRYEFVEILSKYNGYSLYIKVFRDAMKFNDIEACKWNFEPLNSNDPNHGKIFQGVRLPATAHQLQEIADLLNCMLLTPKIIDLIWLQAGLKFDSIVNIKGNIVALSNITDVHQAIEDKINSLGGDDGTKLISCVGKYWCLINDLMGRPNLYGDKACCNYGWFSHSASGPGITPGTQCWQRPGFQHNKQHFDPSQTIRLMYRMARLIHPDGTEEELDLLGIATDENLAPLIHHQDGTLKYLRQEGVPKLAPSNFSNKDDKENNKNDTPALSEETKNELDNNIQPEEIQNKENDPGPKGNQIGFLDRIIKILLNIFK